MSVFLSSEYIGMSGAESKHVADVRYVIFQRFFASAVSWKSLEYMPVELSGPSQVSAATCVELPRNDVVKGPVQSVES